jgi:hypothetical protein
MRIFFFLSSFLFFATFSFAQTSTSPKEKCLNIAISNVKMTDLCSKTASFEVTIENKGLRTIDLPSSNTLGLQYFWSGTAEYEPGAIIIGGVFVKKFGEYGKNLSPDGTYTMTVKVPLAKKSRYQNYLVFIIDAAYLYDECDEKDNVKGIAVK